MSGYDDEEEPKGTDWQTAPLPHAAEDFLTATRRQGLNWALKLTLVLLLALIVVIGWGSQFATSYFGGTLVCGQAGQGNNCPGSDTSLLTGCKTWTPVQSFGVGSEVVVNVDKSSKCPGGFLLTVTVPAKSAVTVQVLQGLQGWKGDVSSEQQLPYLFGPGKLVVKVFSTGGGKLIASKVLTL